MQSSSLSRFVELDLFRGFVLLSILVDHIGGSVLSHFTLHSYALCDATEVFVFLSGYATALAYTAIITRYDYAAVRWHFLRRTFEIYCAFLITASLMLFVSVLMLALSIKAPNIATEDVHELCTTPLITILDIVMMRRQPYLAGVLPMYTLFVFAGPTVVSLAQRQPVRLFGASLALWVAAPFLVNWLPHIEGTRWDFNPFAWQLLFVFGVLAKCQSLYQRVNVHHFFGLCATVIASITLFATAYYRLSMQAALLENIFKQNLAWFRVVNFIAWVWLVAGLIQSGWVKRLTSALPLVVLVGRKGLLCFISSTVISLVVDSLLFAITDGYMNYLLGFAADMVAVGALLLIAKISLPFRKPKQHIFYNKVCEPTISTIFTTTESQRVGRSDKQAVD